MKLVASMMVADGEMERYATITIPALLGYCDEVRILDDGTTDGFSEWAEQYPEVHVRRNPEPRFYEHEGRARNELLAWTMEGKPDWILAIDADELVADGTTLRRSCELADGPVLTLCLWEIWDATKRKLFIRQDGGWAEHDAAVVWAPQRLSQALAIPDRALASGRVPESVARSRGLCAPTALLHFGWTNEAERVARHQRYVVHDGGRFHAGPHLDSILWPDEQVAMNAAPWPPGLEPWRDKILARVG